MRSKSHGHHIERFKTGEEAVNYVVYEHGLDVSRKQAVAKQIRRHAVLRSILEAIADLRKDDDEGAGWVLEQIAIG